MSAMETQAFIAIIRQTVLSMNFFQSGQRTSQSCTHILLLKELGNPTESWSGLWHITPTGFDKFLLVKIIF